ncbi:MAG: hypothetical protein ABW133_00380 [Polyangiaceae bacterium]
MGHAKEARADIAIAGDLDFAAPTDSEVDLQTGGGFGARIGYHAHIPAIVLTPEVGFSYYDFGGNYSAKVYRGIAGMRLGFGEIIRPGVFAHLGMGQLDVTGRDPDASHSALTYDAGAFLDLTLLPLINIGVHGAYNGLNSSGESGETAAITWGSFGAHAELVF